MKGDVSDLQVTSTVQRQMNAFAHGKANVPWKVLPLSGLSTLSAPTDHDVAALRINAKSQLDPTPLEVST